MIVIRTHTVIVIYSDVTVKSARNTGCVFSSNKFVSFVIEADIGGTLHKNGDMNLNHARSLSSDSGST